MKNGFEYEAKLAALREELAAEKERSAQYGRSFNETSRKLNELQPRLTAAEQRNSDISATLTGALELLRGVHTGDLFGPEDWETVNAFLSAAAIKPTESGASE